jgi:hypothetical protein
VRAPARQAPAPPAREAAPRLHPRYQGVWEQRPDDWPDDEPWEVYVTTHDLAERSWLVPAHQAALDAGALDLPERINDHPSVLVSIPYKAAGTQVAWIDKGCAEVVYHAARLGAPTAESCENAGEANGWDDMPTFWFDSADELDRFADLVERQQGGRRWRWYLPSRGPVLEKLTDLADWLLPGVVPRYEPEGGTYAVAIPADELPRVAAALREMPTPSPYGPPVRR